jgi:magnesium-protoporphyrin O-methyltransferase
MHAVGRLMPRADRAPSIAPISQRTLDKRLSRALDADDWRVGRRARIARGFYISEAVEVARR